MFLSKDWSVEVLYNDRTHEIVVSGMVKVEMTIITAELCKIYPVDFDPRILNLELINSAKSSRGILQNVIYTEDIESSRYYHTVMIYYNNGLLISLKVS